MYVLQQWRSVLLRPANICTTTICTHVEHNVQVKLKRRRVSNPGSDSIDPLCIAVRLNC